jgi:hypothetical protein
MIYSSVFLDSAGADPACLSGLCRCEPESKYLDGKCIKSKLTREACRDQDNLNWLALVRLRVPDSRLGEYEIESPI